MTPGRPASAGQPAANVSHDTVAKVKIINKAVEGQRKLSTIVDKNETVSMSVAVEIASIPGERVGSGNISTTDDTGQARDKAGQRVGA